MRRDSRREMIQQQVGNRAAGFLSAAVDDGISLDCVFFELRRRPDMLESLLEDSIDATKNEDGY